MSLLHRFLSTTCMTVAIAATFGVGVGGNSAFANPQDGVVVGGSASIINNGNKLDIIQTTDRAVINWNKFDIGIDEHTQFYQPNSSSIILNRINSSTSSTIAGKLTANGNVILINPNGMLFSKTATVDVNGLVATTADIDNNDFMTGGMNFSKTGNPNATIENQGLISAKDSGLVGLVAPNVINSGVINARLGRAQLSSGDSVTIDFYGDGLLEVKASDALTAQTVTNTGIINAAGGTIAMTAAAARYTVNSVVKVSGELHAPSVGTKNGKIIIGAAGSNAVAGNKASDKGQKTGVSTVLIDGVLDVTGFKAGELGGSIIITGDHIGILDGAKIDASGYNGGGVIHVGGDYLGKGETPTALVTIVQSTAEIKANALTAGNGGEVIVYADDRTEFSGTIEAMGAGDNGNGGFAETSGKNNLLALGTVRLTAGRRGKAGTWLMDPADITITAGTTTNNSGTPTFTATGTGSQVSAASIKANLDAGTNVTIITSNDGYAGNGDIIVSSAISTTGTGSLTLSAYRNITVNATITLTGGSLTFRANNAGAADGSTGVGSVHVNSAIATNGGNITIGGGSGAITAGSGYAVGDYDYGVTIISSVNSGGGNILINGKGAVASVSYSGGVNIEGAGALQATGSGTISIYGIAGLGTMSHNRGVRMAGSASIGTASGSITIVGAGGGSGANTYGNAGVLLATTGVITSTAGGSISITGTGGAGADVNGGNSGIAIVQNQGLISTTSGTITLTGTGGGTGASPYNYGVQISTTTGAPIVSSVSGNILVTGIGGNNSGSGGANTGIYVNVSNAIQTTGSGSIILKGIKGGQSNSVGIAGDAANAYVTTGTGSISAYTDTIFLSTVNTINSAGVLTIAPYTNGSMGVGYSTGYTLNLNDTVLGYINGASYVFGSTVTGTGAANTSDMVINTTKNFADKNVSFISGRDIYLWGNITKSSGTGTVSYLLQANGNISNTSTISGISATSGAVNITLNSDYDQATSAGGAVYLNGGTFNTNGGSFTIGGGTNPLTGNSYISGSDAVTIGTTTTVTTGAGNINIRGENTGTSGSAAVLIAGTMTTTTGTISIYGKSTANNTSSRGIIVSGSANVSTTSGNITLTAINTSGNTGGYAFLLFNTGTTGGTITTTSGNILIDATRGSNEGGFGLSTSNISTPAISSTNGNITILTDTKYMAATGTQISAANGTLTIAQKTNVTMTLGAAGGTLYFSGPELAQFTAANYVFGSVTGGNLTVGTSRNFGDSNVTFRSGGDINLSANLGKVSGTATANYIFQAYGNIYNSSNAGISATTGSINLTLQSDYDGNDSGAVYFSGGTINTNGGNLTIGGGSGAASAGYAVGNATYIRGVYLANTINTGAGTVIIRGKGYNTTTSNNYGVWLFATTMTSTGAGSITVTGIGQGTGASTLNNGINISNGSNISVANGDLNLNGSSTATGTGATNVGIAMVSSTLTSSGTGNIIFVGSSGNTSATDNKGILINSTSVVQATGSGNISFTGTSNGTGVYNIGTTITASTVTANGGNISIVGTGSATGDNFAYGAELYGTTVTNTGNGAITITGTGGGTAVVNSNNANGVIIQNNSYVTTVNGALTVTGTGGGAGNGQNNLGVTLAGTSSYIRTTGTGALNVTGFGGNLAGTGGLNFGIYSILAGAIQTTGSGSITLKAVRGGQTNSYGIGVYTASSVVTTTGTGNITIYTDTIAASANTINSAGVLTLATYSNGTMGVGYSTGYTLNLDNTILGNLNGASYVFGSTITGTGTANTSDLTINTTRDFGEKSLTFISGQDINLAGALTKATGTGTANYLFQAYRNIYNSNSAGINATTGAINLTLQSDYDANNDGMINLTGGTLSSNGGNITIGGGSGTITSSSGYAVGNSGQVTGARINSNINAGGGNIIINGQGANLAVDNSHGVYIVGTSTLIQTSGTGSISINGIGGGNTTSNTSRGIFTNGGTITTTGTGTITLIGSGGDMGGSGSGHVGIYLSGGNIISATGGGAINMTGIGSTSSGGSNYGVYLNNGVITGSGGAINITGTGGAGATSANNLGVSLVTNASITNTGAGTITITATGGAGTGNNNYGMSVASNSSISTTGTGALTITATGGGTGTSASNMGFYVATTSSVSTVNGALNITGIGGNSSGTGGSNHGIYSAVANGIQTTGSGSLTLKGVKGGQATSYSIYGTLANAYATTGTGNITLFADVIGLTATNVINSIGVLTVAAYSNGSMGVGYSTGYTLNLDNTTLGYMNGASYVFGSTITGTGTANTSDLTINTTRDFGEKSLTFISGNDINLAGTLTKSTGVVRPVYTFQANRNIYNSNNAGIIASTGTLNLLIQSDHDGNSDGAVSLVGGSISTGGGHITIGGGSGTVSAGSGYAVGNATYASGVTISTTLSANGGHIVINGRGANLATSNNHGVNITSSISTINTGNIAINGIGSGNANSGTDLGVQISSGAVVSAVDGNITLVGTAGGAGTGAGNYGINIVNGGTTVRTTGAGSLVFTGVGGNSAGSGDNNWGIYVSPGSSGISTTGTGNITLTGTGSTSSGGSNYGMNIAGITANGGNVTLVGTGGAGTGNHNYGIVLNGTVSGLGSSIVTLTGNGGGAGNSSYNYGILVNALSTNMSANGAFNVTGTGGGAGSGFNNYGVYVLNASGLKTTGSGNLTVTGLGGNLAGTGFGNQGVYNATASGVLTTGSGSLIIKGAKGGGSGVGIYGTGANAYSTTGTGNITIFTDSIFLNTANTINSIGTVTVATYSNGTMGVGYSSGYTLNLDNTTLNYINGASYVFGSTVTGTGAANTSNMTINTTKDFVDKSVTFVSGQDINIAGNFTKATGTGTANYLFQANRNIYNSGSSSISATTGLINLTLQSDYDGNSDGAINLANGTISTNGGNITLGGGSGTITAGSGYAVGNATYTNGIFINTALDAGGGNIIANGKSYLSSANGTYGLLASANVSTTGSGTISLNGISQGTGNAGAGYGLYLMGLASTVNGNINLTGTGGGAGTGSDSYGVVFSSSGGAAKTTGTGNIIINGTGGTGGGGGNIGVLFNGVNGIQLTGTGTATVTGTGGVSAGNNNHGISIAGALALNGNNVTFNGTGGAGTGGSNIGIIISTALSNTGTGTLTLNGTGSGTLNSGSDFGVYVVSSGNVSTVDGALNIVGVGGGAGTGANNAGVQLNVGAVVRTTGAGALNVTGTAGNNTGSGSTNHGVLINSGSTLQTTGTGVMTIIGTGSNSSGGYSSGVNIIGTVSSLGSAITITGVGGTNVAPSNDGIRVNGGTVSNTGSGTITMTGTGKGTGTSTNSSGVAIYSSGVVSTVNGALNIVGIGGGAGTGTTNYGVNLNTSAVVKTTGTGALNVTGTGGNNVGSGANNYGVLINTTATLQTTGTGTMTVLGTGSNGSGTNNSGVYVSGAISGAGGLINITGNGGTGAAPSHGVIVVGGTVSNTGSGVVNITGTGGGTGASSGSYGVLVYTGGVVSTVDGALNVTGTGGTGSGGSNRGVAVTSPGVSTIKTTGSGSIVVKGAGGAGSNSNGIFISGVSDGVQTTGTGNITLLTDNLVLNTANAVESVGSLTIAVLTNGATMGVGSGAGTLSFTDALKAYTVAGSYIYGSTTTGDLTVNTAYDYADKNVTFISGGNINLVGNLTKATGAGTANYLFQAYGNIYNTNSAGMSATTGAINLTLQSDYDANSDGAVNLNGGTFATNGGNITIGGGSGTISAGSGFAYGNASNPIGANISGNLSAGGGNIIINGASYTAAGAPRIGVRVSGATVSTTGAGTISINGIGTGVANAGGNNVGVWVVNSGVVSTQNGLLSITGTDQTTGTGNSWGVYVSPGGTSTVKTTGSGDINITGNSRAGSGSTSIAATIANAIQATGTGNIVLKGLSGTGINVSESNAINTASGTITTYSDTYYMSAANAINSGGILNMNSYTNRGMSIGAAVAGTTNIDNASLANLNAATYIFGSTVTGTGTSNTGDITINTTRDFGAGNVSFISGGNINLAGTLTKATGGNAAYLFQANGNIINSNSAGVSSTTGLVNLTMTSDNDISGAGNIVLASAPLTVNGGTITLNSNGQSVTQSGVIGGHETINSANGAVSIGLLDGDTAGTRNLIVNGGTATFTTTAAIGGTNKLNNVFVSADDVVIGANIGGVGKLTLQPTTTTRVVNVNFGTANGTNFNLSTAELGYLVDGWNLINVGNTATSVTSFFGASTWVDPVNFRSAAGRVFTGSVTGIGDASFNFSGSTSFLDLHYDITTAGGTIDLSNIVYLFVSASGSAVKNISTAGGDILVNRVYLSGNDLVLNAGTGSISFKERVDGPKSLTAIGSSMSFTSAWGSATAFGDVTLTSTNSIVLPSITFAAGKTLNVTVTGAGNSITANNAIAMGNAGNITLTADDLTLGANLSGTGTITLQPYNTSRGYNVGYGTADGTVLHLSAAEIAYLVNGWSQINIGRTNGAATSNIGTSSWVDPITFRNNAKVVTYGTITTTDSAPLTISVGAGYIDASGTINSDGAVTINTGTVGYISYGSIINANNSNITFSGDVRAGYTSTDPGSLTLNAGTGTITLPNGVNTNHTVAASYDFTATAGSFVIGGALGGTTALGNVTLNSVNSITLPAITTAAGKNVVINVTGAGNSITTTGAISTSAAGNITLTSDDLILGGALSGTGVLTLQPTSLNRMVVVNATGTSAYSLSTAELGYLVDGWSSILIGRASSTANMIVGTSTWLDPVTFRTTQRIATTAGGVISMTDAMGPLTFNAGWMDAYGTITSANAVAINTSNSLGYVSYGSAVNASNNNITFSNNVSAYQGAVTLNAGTGTITLTRGVNAASGGAYDFTATAGSFIMGNEIGSFAALANVKLTSVNAITLPTIRAENIFVQTTGATADIAIGSGKTLTASGAGDAIQLVSARNFINNSGSSTPLVLTGSGRYLIYSTSPTSDTLSGMTSGFVRYGCTYGGSCPTGTTIAATGNGSIYVYQPTLTVTPTTINTVYGNTVPSLNGYAYGVTGYLTGAAGADSGSNVFTGTLNGSTTYVRGNDVGSYNLNYSSGTLTSSLGYAIVYADNASGINVGQRTLITNLAGLVTKTYDGTDSATLASGNYSLDGVYGSDVLTITNTSGTYDSKNAGTGKDVTVTGLTLSGTKASNYILDSTSVTGSVGTVTQKTLTVTGVSATNKVYDGTDIAALTGTAMFSGLIGSDNVTLGGTATGTFSDKNAGAGKGVTASGYTISGTDANNYSLSQPTGLTGTITQKVLTVTADNKTITYGAAIPTGSVSYSGFVSGENATYLTSGSTVTTGLSGIQDAGTYNGALTASGGTATNYSFTYVAGNLTVLQRALTVTTNNVDNTSGTLNPVFTGSDNLLASDAALINWTYAPIGYTVGTAGLYTIGATANDPSNRLNNYIRTNNYGTYNVGVAPPKTNTIPAEAIGILSVGVSLPTSLIIEIQTYNTSGEVVSTRKEWIDNTKVSNLNHLNVSDVTSLSYSDGLKELLLSQ